MITCPWCGTTYLMFQPNCQNCGGPLFPQADTPVAKPDGDLLPPPPPPRSISESYVWRLLLADAAAIAACVLIFLGVVFTLVGGGLTLGIVTAFVGIPFALLGIGFGGAGAGFFYWRYQTAQKVIRVLREGQATLGQLVSVEENLLVQVNDRHPWVITYRFQVSGHAYTGQVTTLKSPGPALQPEKAVYVLYLSDGPEINTLYPHP